ncbi:Ras-related protein Rab-37 [Halocaridina rubra]|uniref:Ras-related protein Rab-37 n=1 Tax=Halocaridina rubra TaxID=373956 RepID=A0AAN9ADW0_HALRR
MDIDSKAGPDKLSETEANNDDRCRNYSDIKLAHDSFGIKRPHMTSQNGIITLNRDSDIPKSVELRRAKSLSVRGKDSKTKRYSVNFDLDRCRGYDGVVDLSHLNGPPTCSKPPKYDIPEECENGMDFNNTQKTDGSFNSVTLKKSVVESIDKVRKLAWVDSDPGKNERPKSNGAFVQYRDDKGDWKRHSIQRTSQFESYNHSFKVMLIGDSFVGKTCLLTRFKDGTFLSGSFISTVGIDFRVYQRCVFQLEKRTPSLSLDRCAVSSFKRRPFPECCITNFMIYYIYMSSVPRFHIGGLTTTCRMGKYFLCGHYVFDMTLSMGYLNSSW